MMSPTENWGSAPFASAESLALMWNYVRYFIFEYMPFIMIVVAVFVAWAVASLVVQIFTRKNDQDDDPVDFI